MAPSKKSELFTKEDILEQSAKLTQRMYVYQAFSLMFIFPSYQVCSKHDMTKHSDMRCVMSSKDTQKQWGQN